MNIPASQASVLLVEDSLDDVLLTRRALKKCAIEVPLHVCDNGDDGILHLSSQPTPTLVLLDWKLPRRSGAEVLAWIRGTAQHREIPVIVVSSSRLQEDIDAALAAGADAFLEKPLQADEFLQWVERLGLNLLRTVSDT